MSRYGYCWIDDFLVEKFFFRYTWKCCVSYLTFSFVVSSEFLKENSLFKPFLLEYFYSWVFSVEYFYLESKCFYVSFLKIVRIFSIKYVILWKKIQNFYHLENIIFEYACHIFYLLYSMCMKISKIFHACKFWYVNLLYCNS